MYKDSPTPQDPYCSDQAQIAREALEQAKAAHLRLDQLEIDKLQKRLKELEKNYRNHYGFFRTNCSSWFGSLFQTCLCLKR